MTTFAVLPALADGCFVFKWDKKTDINEPTQKAIIVHDAGREDLLLQVKFEGPLEEFGWLIPVPSLPKVEKGSMEAFYELSQLTQRRFGGGQAEGRGGLAMPDAAGPADPVKVIAVKTVGAYEVAILSAKDSGSLARWLELHGYSLPDGKAGIIDDYIRKGWYFVAAKIQLNKPVALKVEAGSKEKASKLSAQNRNAVRKKLKSGELHPLLISFDTPTCVFPLKISAVGGKPSEVSLYVLSSQPLLNQFIFDETCDKLEQRFAELEKNKPKYESGHKQAMENLQVLNAAFLARPPSFYETPTAPDKRLELRRDELIAMAREDNPPVPHDSVEDRFYSTADDFLQCLQADSPQLAQTAKSLPRVKGRHWFLTKVVRTFAPAEMRDLEFVPAIPALSKVLPRQIGRGAAELLTQMGSNAVPVLLTACKSKNATERKNALCGVERIRDQRAIEPLSGLLKDESAIVRLHAIRATAQNWDQRFRQPLIGCFNDPSQEIRAEAIESLSVNENKNRTPDYLALLKDSDPNVRLCSAAVLRRINREAIPPEPLVEILKDPNPDIQCAALHALFQLNRDVVSRFNLKHSGQ